MEQGTDDLIFRPDDVDLSRLPLRRSIAEPTYVLAAFNPNLARLPSDNLLMVRVAEALSTCRPSGGRPGAYIPDRHPLDVVNMTDPRQFWLKHGADRLLALTSLSWLPVIAASGEADLACRTTHKPKALFA